MKISLAQIHPPKGNIAANIEKHIKFIELAISEKSNAIFFPELFLSVRITQFDKNCSMPVSNVFWASLKFCGLICNTLLK